MCFQVGCLSKGLPVTLRSTSSGNNTGKSFLSSGIAFMLQILAQQNLSPAPVAIIFSLEGVFGSIAAWIMLDQFLNEYKVFGIIIILSAVIFSQIAPMYDKRKYG